MRGLKFKYLAFDKMVEDYKGIEIQVDGKGVASGDFGEVLEKLEKRQDYKDLLECEVIDTRPYFDIFVVELESDSQQEKPSKPISFSTNGE